MFAWNLGPEAHGIASFEGMDSRPAGPSLGQVRFGDSRMVGFCSSQLSTVERIRGQLCEQISTMSFALLVVPVQ